MHHCGNLNLEAPIFTEMSSKAPIEIWHTILKYSISVPLFFDPDPVATYGVDILRKYSYEAPYWESERTRNALRRVCYGWNDILKVYDHRFIRLYDVIHDRVPITALPFAIRLDLDDSYGCKCPNICLGRIRQCWMEIEHIWEMAPFSSKDEAALAPPIAWKVEIIKGWIPEHVGYCSILKTRAPNLQAMIAQSLGMVSYAADLPPTLRLFMTDINESRGHFDIIGMDSITTLHLAVDSLEIPIGKGILPGLRHLSIDRSEYDHSTLQQDVCDFLEHICSQLQTLHLSETLTSVPIEPRLWDILLRVERLQLPYSWDNCGVPRHHPVQTIQISIRAILSAGRGMHIREDIAHLFLPLSSEHHWVVRMDTTWGEEFFTRPSESVVSIDEYYKARLVPFVDSNGESFIQYVVFLITAFWRQPGRRYRKVPADSDYITMHF
jgi:hypothetical protein